MHFVSRRVSYINATKRGRSPRTRNSDARTRPAAEPQRLPSRPLADAAFLPGPRALRAPEAAPGGRPRGSTGSRRHDTRVSTSTRRSGVGTGPISRWCSEARSTSRVLSPRRVTSPPLGPALGGGEVGEQGGGRTLGGTVTPLATALRVSHKRGRRETGPRGAHGKGFSSRSHRRVPRCPVRQTRCVSTASPLQSPSS